MKKTRNDDHDDNGNDNDNDRNEIIEIINYKLQII